MSSYVFIFVIGCYFDSSPISIISICSCFCQGWAELGHGFSIESAGYGGGASRVSVFICLTLCAGLDLLFLFFVSILVLHSLRHYVTFVTFILILVTVGLLNNFSSNNYLSYAPVYSLSKTLHHPQH